MTSFRKAAARLALSSLMLTAVLPVTSADAATWKVDLAKSKLGFSGTQTGTKFQGVFTRWNSEIEFDPDHLEASHILVTVDLATATTKDAQRDKALPESNWFDIGHFPTATFDTREIHSKGANDYEAVGTLTLRGVAAPLTLPFALQIDGTSAHAKGHAELSRRTFGIGQGPWATDQWVAFEFGVDFDVIATTGN
jgi:polyisoprenoid-binding protein YceI